jgi:hypothetical protein
VHHPSQPSHTHLPWGLLQHLRAAALSWLAWHLQGNGQRGGGLAQVSVVRAAQRCGGVRVAGLLILPCCASASIAAAAGGGGTASGCAVS